MTQISSKKIAPLQQQKRRRKSSSSSDRSSSSSSSTTQSKYLVFFVKILIIVLILLWLAPLVTSKKRSKRRKNKKGRIRAESHASRLECEMECIDYLPEEAMNCIFECWSSKCYEELYVNQGGGGGGGGGGILEPGQIDINRGRQMEECVQEEIKNQRKQERLAEKQQAQDKNNNKTNVA